MAKWNLGYFGFAPKKFNQKGKEFFEGTPERQEWISQLAPEQKALYEQLLAANAGQGAGGAYGQAADYYRDLLSDDSNTFNSMASPELRRFNEDIIPSLAEQFAGMGSGALSSSGFRNAAVNAGTDLSERLGAIRAQLRQQGAQGLMNLGNQGLQSYGENVIRPGTEGFLSQVAPAVGTAVGAFFGGPAGASAGYQAGNMFSNKGKSSWRGGGNMAQPGYGGGYGGF